MKALRIVEVGVEIKGGSLIISDTSSQIVESVLLSSPGEWKASPILGANLSQELGGTTDPFLPGRVREQVVAAGVTPRKITINNNHNIEIEL